MSSVLANHLDVHALNEDARKNVGNIKFHVSSGVTWRKGISSLFARYLDRDGDIFITYIYIDTHMAMKEPKSI